MAQDFRASFGLGSDDKSIAGVDAEGVAFAAIQGLNAKLEQRETALRSELLAKDAAIAGLRGEVDELHRAVKALMARTAREPALRAR